MSSDWRFAVCDALEKVVPGAEPRPLDPELGPLSFPGGTATFQVAFRPPATRSLDGVGRLRAEVEVTGGASAALFRVELVPVALPAFQPHDDGYLDDVPGLYPDLLRPLAPGDAFVPLLAGWSSVWVETTLPSDAPGGTIEVTVRLRQATTGAVLFAHRQPIEVSPLALPEPAIAHTEWVHIDSIADHYGVEVFSEEHWRIVERFLVKARELGIDTLLTPVWSPPLDTAIGTYRPNIQLIDIDETPDGICIDFTRLARWIRLCRRVGIRTLEIPPLFSQWGATSAASFITTGQRGTVRRFGWATPADAPEYRAFLRELLPSLKEFLDREWGLREVHFHLSDEPTAETADTYGRARRGVADLLAGCIVIDALSDVELVRTGLVPTPIVASTAVGSFAAAGIHRTWVYYCVAQQDDVSNRFIAQPAARTRAIGAQLFVGGHVGFLHWAFAFYYDQYSERSVDPFSDTCAGGAYPGGDTFLVYPGPDGEPWPSIRFRAIADAMEDHRLLTLSRSVLGTAATRAALAPEGSWSLDDWPRDPEAILRVRRRLVDGLTAVRGSGGLPSASGSLEPLG
ncbi:DUF4091 domain-containing protein [Leifsonia aquatica]|uniref:DUF4091 domain-containing protein n=1 Tax=Leifsonia aquatica TaxID=144185 RepID=UPI00384EFF79